MKVGRIAYANTEPFFYAWNSPTFDLLPGTPRGLADAARRGEIVAAPLPLVECWALADQFEPLGDWCIAAGPRCRSVYVLSHVPFAELDHAMVGVTKDSATSVVLCETLIRQKYGNDVRLRKGLQFQDTGWLVIGDQALQLAQNPAGQAWPFITDLASEWWDWKKLPFVFAKWVVRKDLRPELRAELKRTVSESLSLGRAKMDALAVRTGSALKLPPAFVASYLNEFIYEMTPEAHAGEEEFRRLVTEGADRASAIAAH